MKMITDNNIPHYLVMTGEEQAIIDVYIKQITERLSCKYISCDSVVDVLNKTRRKSLDKSTRLFVVIDDDNFIKNADAWERVKSEFDKSKDYLILRYNTMSNSQFANKHKQNLVKFSHLSSEVLYLYINRILNDLSEKNANKLIDYCGHDYGRILLECDKIKSYQAAHLTCIDSQHVDIQSSDECFEQLDKQGLFYKEIGDITFELTNAVLGGYTEKAIDKLYDAKRKGESVMTIANILYAGFRNLLAYAELGTNKQGAMERTGMTKGELWGCTKNAGGYSMSELRRNMLFCQNVETGIKSGLIDESIALDYLVLHCLR